MGGGKLPTLSKRDAKALVAHFAPGSRQEGHQFVGINRKGVSFTLHLEHDYTLPPILLTKALRYLAISRDEFGKWYRKH